MRLLKVTAKSNASDQLNVIIRCLREDQAVSLLATGSDDIQQLLQIVNVVRQQSLADDLPVVYASKVGFTDDGGADRPSARVSLSLEGPANSKPATDWSEIEDEINQQFEEWQVVPDDDSPLARKMSEHHSESPILSGGDVDAAWDQADVGEETVGGSTPTPDQDVVDELGLAAGLTYEDEEPLHTRDILEYRDHHRWELNPASAEEEE
jgi:stage V sporulation protein SpoVS